MAMSPIQATPGAVVPYANSSPSYPLKQMAGTVDMISLLGEYLGIPFPEFTASSTIDSTHPWTVAMSALAQEATGSGVPILLQLALSRQNVVGLASNQNGVLHVQQSWTPGCADFSDPKLASLGTAYVNYVTWMARHFKPAYLVVAVEINLYYDQCGGDTPGWRALVSIERLAYEAARKELPNAVIFPSVALEPLYNGTLNGWNQAEYNALAGLERDRFGISTYSFGTPTSTGFAAPADLPPDYLTRVKDLNRGEVPIAITETGWISDSISVNYQNSCVNPFLPSSTAATAAYLDFVLESARRGAFDLVTWWSSRDLIPSSVMTQCMATAAPPSYSACAGDVWCTEVNKARNNDGGIWGPGWDEFTYKAFGTMGLLTFTGAPKGNLPAVWKSELAIPHTKHGPRPLF